MSGPQRKDDKAVAKLVLEDAKCFPYDRQMDDPDSWLREETIVSHNFITDCPGWMGRVYYVMFGNVDSHTRFGVGGPGYSNWVEEYFEGELTRSVIQHECDEHWHDVTNLKEGCG